MEIDLPQIIFTFETKAPKIVQEKWAAFPPRMENRFSSNFFTFETKAPKLLKKMRSTSP